MQQKQLRWKDINVGQEIPGFSLKIDATRIVTQVEGSQDYFPVHHDLEFARSAGHRDVFVNTGFTGAALGRVITDWISPDGWLRKFRMEMRKMNMPGDTMTCKGKVTNKYVEDGENYVECEVWSENQREGATTFAKATFTLP